MHRFMILGIALAFAITALVAQEKQKTDTQKAAISRKKLKEKITYECADAALRDVLPELTEQVGVPFRIEKMSGVSGNLKITYKGDKQPLEKVLAEMFKKNGLGFYIESDAKSAEDGTIWISNRQTERGYRTGDELASGKTKEKSDENKTAGKDKNKSKEKAEAKEKKTGKDKAEATEKTEDDGEKLEQEAARKLKFAQTLMDDGKTEKARTRFEEIIGKYPKTKAAAEAKELLKKLDK